MEHKCSDKSYKEAYNKMIEYVNDQLAALDVAEKLSVTKQYTMEDNYRDIVDKAIELGIKYVGMTKQRLLDEINKHTI